MKAPFPWFGGKRKVASQVWTALGDVDNYVEPFAGSLAVLLERPDWHTNTTATANDMDRYIANFWRAVEYSPDKVAHYADWPVNEADLEARHLWLVNDGRQQLADGLWNDPEWCNPKIAGWWVWGICSWIGSGWCSGDGPHVARQLPHLGDAGQGVNRQLPHLGDAGQGVNRQRPHLGDAGQGVNRQRPHLGDAGQGVNRQRPHLGNAGRGSAIRDYMRQLQTKLRDVRVCCGDWQRVVTAGALSYGATVGVFFDPPYSEAGNRQADLYNHDSLSIAHDVREWCLANGDNPRYRIVLAGYYDEHAVHMPNTWRVEQWKANAAYQNGNRNGTNQTNRHKETLWYSPHCLIQQPALFAEAG